ncbi:2b protein [Ageratum latent virus 1998]|uniref:2b protein n=1 Tax=Ageratum latent virus 1998 TaxID=2755028 RepID=S4UZ74_9BROM|nr:2b protein [Ageratum latent virus 1998]AGN29719.1 2b protein [Ageratum latent virus 1998]
MMFIPILLLVLTHGLNAELMMPTVQTDRGNVNPGREEKPEPEVVLNPEETVKITAGSVPTSQYPMSQTLEERSPPGKEGSNCIDCAVRNLPEAQFSVKVPKLNINFEISEFPSARLLFANLADRVKMLPFVKSLNVPNDLQRLQLRSMGDVDVHISIPKFGWVQVLKLSDVITGFDLPKIPTIAPKLESCVGDCLTTNKS